MTSTSKIRARQSPHSMDIAVGVPTQPGGKVTLASPPAVSIVPPPGPIVSDAELHIPGVHKTPEKNVPSEHAVAKLTFVHPVSLQHVPEPAGALLSLATKTSIAPARQRSRSERRGAFEFARHVAVPRAVDGNAIAFVEIRPAR